MKPKSRVNLSPVQDKDVLDAIIIGGGPAGLSAALILGRCLRRVLVCDSGEPRNGASRAMHGFLSRDGISPAEFAEISRAQLSPYETISVRRVKAVGAKGSKGDFTVTLDGGELVFARMLLLATGLVDELPEIENFRQFYGVSAHNCPYCDGWEHRGQPIAVVGSSKSAVDLALELRLWSADILLCTNGKNACDRDSETLLVRNGVAILNTPIARLEGTGHQLDRIRFQDGSESVRHALFFSPGQHQRSPLAEMLGCQFCEEDGCMKCEQDASTCVPGVFVAGNASRGLQLVIAAAAEGMQAGCAINCALLEADAEMGAVRSGTK